MQTVDADLSLSFLQSSIEAQRERDPIFAICCKTNGSAAAPLGALRIDKLFHSADILPQFSGTLLHLVLPGLFLVTVPKLIDVIGHLTALEVCVFI